MAEFCPLYECDNYPTKITAKVSALYLDGLEAENDVQAGFTSPSKVIKCRNTELSTANDADVTLS